MEKKGKLLREIYIENYWSCESKMVRKTREELKGSPLGDLMESAGFEIADIRDVAEERRRREDIKENLDAIETFGSELKTLRDDKIKVCHIRLSSNVGSKAHENTCEAISKEQKDLYKRIKDARIIVKTHVKWFEDNKIPLGIKVEL